MATLKVRLGKRQRHSASESRGTQRRQSSTISSRGDQQVYGIGGCKKMRSPQKISGKVPRQSSRWPEKRLDPSSRKRKRNGYGYLTRLTQQREKQKAKTRNYMKNWRQRYKESSEWINSSNTMRKQGSKRCKEQCQVHEGEEDHARPGWTTSRRGQDSPWKSQSEWQRTGINGESTSMVWPTLDRGRLKNRTEGAWQAFLHKEPLQQFLLQQESSSTKRELLKQFAFQH